MATMAAAHLLPAFRLGQEIIFGWYATTMSALGSFFVVVDRGELLPVGLSALACLCGLAANLAALAAIALGVARRPRSGRVCGLIGLWASAGSIAALAFSPVGFAPGVGCVLWVMAFALLALAPGASGSGGAEGAWAGSH
jgi:hypothetical protein